MERIEQAHQKALIAWASWVRIGKDHLTDHLWHIPNGGARTKTEAAILKGMGTMRGVPDLQLTIAVAPHHGLFIEMKKPGEGPDATQREVHERLRAEGYRVDVCTTVDEAMASIRRYLAPSGRLITEFKPDHLSTHATVRG